MAKKIAIYGAGGFAREVLQAIKDINKHHGADIWDPLGYLVDKEYITSDLINGLPILGSSDWLHENSDVFIIVALGSPALRRRVSEDIKAISNNSFAKIIHPRAWIGDDVEIEEGSVICAGALITTNIHIGEHVHVNIGSTIGHDAHLDAYVTLNPSVNISGNVRVGTGCEIGTGSVVIPHANIAEWSIIGAGSVVTKVLPPNITAVGSPAKIIKERVPGWHCSLPANK